MCKRKWTDIGKYEEQIKKLREVLFELIENHAVDMFYVGQQGAFDGIVRSVLKELVSLYPHIN